MSERSYAGYQYKQRLSAGFYGEVYQVVDAAGKEAQILHVDPQLAESAEFTDALTASARRLAALDHSGIVGTREIGRAADDSLVVIEPRHGPTTVEDLLRESGGSKLPEPIAAAIGLRVVSALASAHDAGVIHGAIHPRSVFVGLDGAVMVGDFAVGRALAATGVHGLDSRRFKGFGGYLAAELALGEDPTPAADVFAAGALVFVMLSGAKPPGTLNTTPAVERVIQRALDTDLSRRYADARALLDDFSEALDDDNWPRADDDEIAQHLLAMPSPRKDNVKAATEDLLSLLDKAQVEISDQVAAAPGRAMSEEGSFESIAPAPRPAPRVVPPADAKPVEEESPDMPAARLSAPVLAADMEDLLAELDGDPPTRVDTVSSIASEDPISQLIRLSPVAAGVASVDDFDPIATEPPQNTPLPEPVALHDRPSDPSISAAPPAPDGDAMAALAAVDALSAEDEPADDVEAEALAAVDALAGDTHADSTAADAAEALAAIDALTHDAEPEPTPARPVAAPVAPPAPVSAAPSPPAAHAPRERPAVRPAIEIPESLGDVPSLGKKRGVGKLFWVVAVAGVLGALAWVITTQRGLRDESQKRAEELEKANEEALKRFRSTQPKSGTIVITSQPTEAAVWMSLGRTPTRSDLLSAETPHQLRIERDGFQTQFFDVTAVHWTPMAGADTLEAVVKVKLEPGTPSKPVPAYPPEPKPEAAASHKEGKGYIRVETDQPGAQVWLLVGFTPEFELSSEAGPAYEFKLLKDGFLPGFATITTDDWKLDPKGEALRSDISRDVVLTPQPKKR